MKSNYQALMQNFITNQMVVSIFAGNRFLVIFLCVKVRNHHFLMEFLFGRTQTTDTDQQGDNNKNKNIGYRLVWAEPKSVATSYIFTFRN